MLPNMSPPVDRSAEAMQGIKYRAGTQAFMPGVGASNVGCTICCAAANALPFPANIAAKAACGAAGCSC